MKHAVQVALSVATLCAPPSATADDNDDNIREIIEVTGALQLAEQVMEAGGRWGQALGIQACERVVERLHVEGLDVPS